MTNVEKFKSSEYFCTVSLPDSLIYLRREQMDVRAGWNMDKCLVWEKDSPNLKSFFFI